MQAQAESNAHVECSPAHAFESFAFVKLAQWEHPALKKSTDASWGIPFPETQVHVVYVLSGDIARTSVGVSVWLPQLLGFSLSDLSHDKLNQIQDVGTNQDSTRTLSMTGRATSNGNGPDAWHLPSRQTAKGSEPIS